MGDYMEDIKCLLDSFKGETYNLCYKLLIDADDRSVIFEFVCKNYTSRPKNGTIQIEEFFSKEEIEQYESLHGDTVNGLLSSTIKKCNLGIISPDAFYRSLWNSFELNFTDNKELAFAFYYTIIDSNIPYMYLGKPVSMSNERFHEIVEANSSSIKKVDYIIRSGYSQRTEKASLLLNCLDEIEDFDSKAVVLAQAIALFSRNQLGLKIGVDGLLRQIDSRIEELEAEEAASEK